MLLNYNREYVCFHTWWLVRVCTLVYLGHIWTDVVTGCIFDLAVSIQTPQFNTKRGRVALQPLGCFRPLTIFLLHCRGADVLVTEQSQVLCSPYCIHNSTRAHCIVYLLWSTDPWALRPQSLHIYKGPFVDSKKQRHRTQHLLINHLPAQTLEDGPLNSPPASLYTQQRRPITQYEIQKPQTICKMNFNFCQMYPLASDMTQIKHLLNISKLKYMFS